MVSTHSRPKAAGPCVLLINLIEVVSTHSRPKAAGSYLPLQNQVSWFQHTAARRRLGGKPYSPVNPKGVSTHSRPKAAGYRRQTTYHPQTVSTHSRPKAAGFFFEPLDSPDEVSTHSRPKAAGRHLINDRAFRQCFNTQPPEGGWASQVRGLIWHIRFQHTAARRRLARYRYRRQGASGFNTQPPEGGWVLSLLKASISQ